MRSGGLVLAVLAVAFLMLGGVSTVGAQPSDAGVRSEIEALKQEQATIRRELAEIKALLRGQAASAQPGGSPGDVLVAVQHAPVLGQGTARVTIVEFSDYQ